MSRTGNAIHDIYHLCIYHQCSGATAYISSARSTAANHATKTGKLGFYLKISTVILHYGPASPNIKTTQLIQICYIQIQFSS